MVSQGESRAVSAIDPILVRVAFVVLAIFGGSGVLLYLAGWIFIPSDGHADSAGERFFRNHNALAITGVVIVGLFVIGPMLFFGLWGDGPGIGGIVLLFLAIAAVIALNRRGDPSATPPAAPSTAVPTAVVPTSAPVQAAPAGTTSPTLALPTTALPTTPPPPTDAPPAPPTAPPPPPAPPRDKSILGRLTFATTLLVAGTLIALNLSGVVSIGAVTVLAASLGVVAIGLLVGTLVGRSRWLIALGVLLTMILIPTAAVPDDIRWNAGAGAGDRTYRVASPDDLRPSYELGVGTLTLDLRRIDLAEPVTVDASLGAGELRGSAASGRRRHDVRRRGGWHDRPAGRASHRGRRRQTAPGAALPRRQVPLPVRSI